MIITSTEFQQNVGLYLKEAQKGSEVIIRKVKPANVSFKLSLHVQKPISKSAKKFDRAKFERLIKKMDINDGINDGIIFQKKVRS